MSDGQTTTQSKYKKKKKSEVQPQIDPNEVRIKGNQGHVKRYVDYACSLLEGKRVQKLEDDESPPAEEAGDAEKKNEPAEPMKFDTIVLKATGRAINKAVTTAEVVKRRIPDLHQITALDTLEITDEWEPTEQGLKTVETKRRVASITITLSRDMDAVKKHEDYGTGYQQPLSSDTIKPFVMQQQRMPNRRRGGGGYRRGGRRNNRGGGGGNNDNRRDGGNGMRDEDRGYNDRGPRGPRGPGRRGRGPRGPPRGGYGGPRGGYGGGYGGGRGGGGGGGRFGPPMGGGYGGQGRRGGPRGGPRGPRGGPRGYDRPPRGGYGGGGY